MFLETELVEGSDQNSQFIKDLVQFKADLYDTAGVTVVFQA